LFSGQFLGDLAQPHLDLVEGLTTLTLAVRTGHAGHVGRRPRPVPCGLQLRHLLVPGRFGEAGP
jgi:hypothetical protein